MLISYYKVELGAQSNISRTKKQGETF